MRHTPRLHAWRLIPAMFAGVIVAVAVSAVAAVHAQDTPIPGGVYTGTLVDSDGSCSQGALTLAEQFEMRLNSPGTAIRLLTLHDLEYDGDFFGPTRELYDQRVDLAIASDGSFDGDVRLGDPITAQFAGRFQGDTLAGSFGFSVDGVVECSGTFNAGGSPLLPLESRTWTAGVELLAAYCGTGQVTVTVSNDGLSLIQAGVTEVRVSEDGPLATGSATFDEGTVPIAADGSFGWVYFPGTEPGQEIALNGTFAPWFSGLVTALPSVAFCPAMSFDGGPRYPVAFRLPSSGPGSADPLAFPDAGGGAPADRGRIGLVWPAFAAAGVAAFVLALALRRRRGV